MAQYLVPQCQQIHVQRSSDSTVTLGRKLVVFSERLLRPKRSHASKWTLFQLPAIENLSHVLENCSASERKWTTETAQDKSRLFELDESESLWLHMPRVRSWCSSTILVCEACRAQPWFATLTDMFSLGTRSRWPWSCTKAFQLLKLPPELRATMLLCVCVFGSMPNKIRRNSRLAATAFILQLRGKFPPMIKWVHFTRAKIPWLSCLQSITLNTLW